MVFLAPGRLPACWAFVKGMASPPVKYRADACPLTAVWTGVRQEAPGGRVRRPSTGLACVSSVVCVCPFYLPWTPGNLGMVARSATFISDGEQICSLKSGRTLWRAGEMKGVSSKGAK